MFGMSKESKKDALRSDCTAPNDRMRAQALFPAKRTKVASTSFIQQTPRGMFYADLFAPHQYTGDHNGTGADDLNENP